LGYDAFAQKWQSVALALASRKSGYDRKKQNNFVHGSK
jgi:hypothetical protein